MRTNGLQKQPKGVRGGPMPGSGAPKGNKNASKNKPWAQALLHIAIGEPEKLERLAQITWQQALDGDHFARKEIADRLDGKPVARVEGTINSDDDASLSDLERIARIAAILEAGRARADRQTSDDGQGVDAPGGATD